MQEAPQRIQLRRSKGWRMPANTVKVDRSTPWGNPFKADKHCTAAASVAAFRAYLYADTETARALRAAVQKNLAGKNLACWCALNAPCHAQLLLELANAPARLRTVN